MIYLIGGAPRVGKSIIAKKLSLATSFKVISTDDLEISPDHRLLPGFSGDPSENTLSPDERVRLLVREAGFLQPKIEELIKKARVNNTDLIIEGVQLLPGHVAKLAPADLRPIFIGSRDIKLILQGMAQNTQPNDWLKNANEVVRRQAAEFTCAFSRCIFNETTKYQMPYKERTENFEADVDNIINNLK